jgi:hypothetical protein
MATEAGGIDSLESILGPLKSLKIRAPKYELLHYIHRQDGAYTNFGMASLYKYSILFGSCMTNISTF